jgi:large subunit ribosomal protein L32
MANPKRKLSHARGAKRRTHYTVSLPVLVPHPGHRSNEACPEMLLPHTACPACGIYQGRVVEAKQVRRRGRARRKAAEEAE